jgi:hypothetical protein
MPPATILTEHHAARATAVRNLLHAGKLPGGVRTVLTCLLAAEERPPTVAEMAGGFGCTY